MVKIVQVRSEEVCQQGEALESSAVYLKYMSIGSSASTGTRSRSWGVPQ